eukprot:Skav210687  [mRNA]  locus=scaffold346:117589:120056:+ [translate_table: standard]
MQVTPMPPGGDGASNGGNWQPAWIKYRGCHFRGGAKRTRTSNEDDGSRKLHSSPGRRAGTIWTLNCGGFSGMWRLLESLQEMKVSSRPSILCMQEIKNRRQEWLAAQSTWCGRGYRAYASQNVTEGSGCDGVVTLVANTVNAVQERQVAMDSGSGLALSFGNTMVVNVYLPPREVDRAEECALLSEWLQGFGWVGGWLLAGDWNEEYHEGWIGALRSPLDVFQLPLANSTSTSFDVKHDAGGDYVFQKQPAMECPLWLDKQQWSQTVQEAFDHCVMVRWGEACAYIESLKLEHSDDPQFLDTWMLTRPMFLMCFRVAYSLSLSLIPADYKDELEMRKVARLFTHLQTKRLHEQPPQLRSFPKGGERQTIYVQRLRNNLGTATDLFYKLKRGANGKEVENLQQKLSRRYTVRGIAEVHQLMLRLRKQVEEMGAKAKHSRTNEWKTRMRTNISKRGDWLNRRRTSFCPAVEGLDGTTAFNKEQSIKSLAGFWGNLHQSLEWKDPEDRSACAKQIADFFASKTQQLSGLNGPNEDDFVVAIRLQTLEQSHFATLEAYKGWISYDGCSARESVCSLTGLPQGDAASPMVLGLMLAKGLGHVQRLAPRDQLYASIYLDDRFLASTAEESLMQAVKT